LTLLLDRTVSEKPKLNADYSFETSANSLTRFEQKYNEAVPVLSAGPGRRRDWDGIDARFALLARLRNGWDGPASKAPSRRAISVLFAATERAFEFRDRIGPTAHADGYLSSEWEDLGHWFTVEVHPDRIVYVIESDDNERTWTSPLSVRKLADFLRGAIT
jgi:hypothetical protein